jgi:hypothetical protein
MTMTYKFYGCNREGTQICAADSPTRSAVELNIAAGVTRAEVRQVIENLQIYFKENAP